MNENTATSTEAVMLPPVDVIEDAAGLTLLADLPGVPKDRLKLQVESDTLTLEGEVQLELPDKMEANYIELAQPRFRRVFTLSKELDSNKVAAEFNNGVLKLRIPKVEQVQPRKVQIKVG